MRVGEIAEAIGLAQSTTSVHLQRLLGDEFVRVDRSRTSSWYVINAACIEEFPRAAAQVMGTLAGSIPFADMATRAPWQKAVRASGD